MYAVKEGTGLATNTMLGKTSNGVTENDLKRKSVYGRTDGATPGIAKGFLYSPGIYRPRESGVSTDGLTRESLPADDYYLPSLAELCNIFLAGPIRDGTDRPFTTEILREDLSSAFTDRMDIGRTPSTDPGGAQLVDVPQNAGNARYPDIPPAYLFHEFFARTPGHQARTGELRRLYGMINMNTVALGSQGQTIGATAAAWYLPWPVSGTVGTPSTNSGNRMALGQGSASFDKSTALSYIRQYRDKIETFSNRATGAAVPNLRTYNGSDIRGFLSPGEVGIPLAAYMDTLLKTSVTPSADYQKDCDYVRARNQLFSYLSDCVSTRSDVYACYVTVQVGQQATDGRRWRYVGVIDRSNVLKETDKAAVVLLTQMR